MNCKQCGALIEPDLQIDGYGVRCECAGKKYRALQSELDTLKQSVKEAVEEMRERYDGNAIDILRSHGLGKE